MPASLTCCFFSLVVGHLLWHSLLRSIFCMTDIVSYINLQKWILHIDVSFAKHLRRVCHVVQHTCWKPTELLDIFFWIIFLRMKKNRFLFSVSLLNKLFFHYVWIWSKSCINVTNRINLTVIYVCVYICICVWMYSCTYCSAETSRVARTLKLLCNTWFHDIWINLWSATFSTRNGKVNFSWQPSSCRHVISSTPLIMSHMTLAISRITPAISRPGYVFDIFRQSSDFDGLILKLRSPKISNIISHYTWPHLVMHLFPPLNTHAQTTSEYLLFFLRLSSLTSMPCHLLIICLESPPCCFVKFCWFSTVRTNIYSFCGFLFFPLDRNKSCILCIFRFHCLYSSCSRTYSSFSCAGLSFILCRSLHRKRDCVSFL